MDIEDAELALKTIQDLRSEYRIMNKELEMVLPDYEENYRKTLVSTLETITNFIKDMKRHKQKLKMNTINTDLEKDSRKVEFIVEEIIQTLNRLEMIFKTNLVSESKIHQSRNTIRSTINI